ncbi:MAG: glycoside hydrolase family 16 protein [Novosphingobium sp.]
MLLLAAGLSPVGAVAASAPAPLPVPGDALVRPDGYQVVWGDGFDTDGAPDSNRWHFETSRNRQGWYNGELQYYASERRNNARIENGRLIIEARPEDLSGLGLNDWSGQQFSSARLTTRNHASWRHGFFQIRARLPCIVGSWPAIWLLPEHQDMAWQGGEIDIAEAVGYEPGTIHHAIQTANRNFIKGNHERGESHINYCGGFHDYQLLWTEDRIVIGIDGKVGFAARPEGFDRKMILILNVAVGGAWAGAKGIDTEAFPARMEVASVTVWQKAGTP